MPSQFKPISTPLRAKKYANNKQARTKVRGDRPKLTHRDCEKDKPTHRDRKNSNRRTDEKGKHAHRYHDKAEPGPPTKNPRKGYAPHDIRRKWGGGKSRAVKSDRKNKPRGDKCKVPKFSWICGKYNKRMTTPHGSMCGCGHKICLECEMGYDLFDEYKL
jgi:hypothetical protein